ncbi:MAG: glycosyltransferase family 4 protein [Oscillospiraceae bacterium]|nr:glycosyltransferase family 4 protein [Oscillospiraceae bacterium]
MKVLLIASVQSHICQFHRPLVDMLHRHGAEVHVAAHNNLDVKPGLKLDFADKVIEVPFVRSVADLHNVNAYKAIKKVIDSDNYDVVHCNTPIASVLTRLAARDARKRGTKVIYTAHGFQFFTGSSKKDWMIYYPIEKEMARFTDLIFTINHEDTARAEAFHGPKVVYIPGVGVDTEKFRTAERKDVRGELGIPSDAFMMLTVGELFPRKNQKVLIDAMQQLKNLPIHLVLCGNGILLDELQQQCRDNGVEDRVHFAGYRRDIPGVMKGCDLYLFPSKREGLGLAGIEAMASGLPVVSSNINGILDYMIEGKTGHMCDPNDADAFARAILDLYHDPDKRREIGAFNVEQAKNFDQAHSAAALEEGYRWLLGF